jgi:hypothetical protein
LFGAAGAAGAPKTIVDFAEGGGAAGGGGTCVAAFEATVPNIIVLRAFGGA